MFFSGWQTLLRTVVIGVLAYAALVSVLRASGKRTLSKWNAFDLVVTVAFGSSLATALLSKDTSFVQVALAFVLLTGLQFVVTWLSARSRTVERFVKASPRLLLYRGRLCREAMLRERVTEQEILAALRGKGISSLEAAGAVVLETDGSFSVLRELAPGASALRDVAGHPPAEEDAPHSPR